MNYTRAVAIWAAVLLCAFALCRAVMGSALDVRFLVTVPQVEEQQLRAETEELDLADIGLPVIQGNSVIVRVSPKTSGKTGLFLLDSQGEMLGYTVLSIGPLRTVYNEADGSFTGDRAALVCFTAFLLGVSLIMLLGYLSARGPGFYAYSTILCIGSFFFTLVTGLLLLSATLQYFLHPGDFLMLSVYSTICSAGPLFLHFTFPPVAVFALAMAVSNVELLRHNRPRLESIVGLIVSFVLLAGGLFGLWFSNRDFAGSLLEYRINCTLENVYCVSYAYFECMLLGAAICGLQAAKHQPLRDRDVILILGCWFRPDGTLPPLLKGRADRAIAFWKEQKEKAGKEALLIPSGGQGKDEPMPEAAAIRAYLLAQGIPEHMILTEEQSASTLQNMAYSRRLMEENDLHGKVAYATTNYHVFRSGLWAAQAGLPEEGIGSKTAWWFWPNAFMRECVGLMQYRWKQELVLLLCLLLLFGLLSMTIIG